MANFLGRNSKPSKPKSTAAGSSSSTPAGGPLPQFSTPVSPTPGAPGTPTSAPKKQGKPVGPPRAPKSQAPKTPSTAATKTPAVKVKKTKAEQRNQAFAIGGTAVIVIGIIIFLVATGSGSSSGSKGSGNTSASTALANQPSLLTVATTARAYSDSHGKTFPSTYVMRNEIAKALPKADVIDANNFPKQATRKNGQIAVLVSGGPLFAAGEYSTSANNGLGGCVYVASYAFGPGHWGYGTGEPGVACGAISHGQPSMNSVKWHTMSF